MLKELVSLDLAPKEAISYLKNKGYKLNFDYDEMMHEAHHKAFTVAKITRLDLLADIKEQLHQAQKSGHSYNSFKKNIKPTLIKKGWWGDVEVTNPKTGEVKEIFVGNRRLKNIFYTNTRVAYQVQKAKKIYDDDSIKYIKYSALLDNRTRASHKALHNVILPKEDPFWKSHFPPNGWNCRCSVRGVPAHHKVKPTDKSTLPSGAVDKDWDYDVREGRHFDKFKGNAIEDDTQSSFKDFNLPSAKDIDKSKLAPAPTRYTIEDKAHALEVLKKEVLGGEKSIKIKTPITDIAFDEKSLEHIVQKDLRAEFARYIKPTLQEPNEIWAVKSKLSKDDYYQKRYRFVKLFQEKKDNTLAVCELLRDGSVFVTFIKTRDLSYIDNVRKGILMWIDGE